ncbi:Isoquinoline 1-oxidoreductase beta subunit [Marinobacterium lacunae]|uniref:Isoquinoline 1-oxidoreductase beta subunit n=1 Tax=Marinobacterium lacunae TaxID=1232683 RepID=A0A081FV93_9GAMM|nr:xanthine dehydrogenase family protein molybdopterin-binding subunit [Marinobacterium lacunae]KEA62448.1 Isoquinoline 1-oxidoreductase beta subunit [Marinobacterium lacunae]
MSAQLSRRNFLKAAGASALLVGFTPRGLLAAGYEDSTLNPFVRIDSDGVVTVILKHFEMGQGTSTGLTTLIAEELDADWASVRIDFAPSDTAKYKNLLFGAQGTGGSTAIANSFMQYRKAGAAARDLLVRAAAEQWGVGVDRIRIDKGVITDGQRTAGFADVIHSAARLEPNPEPQLKTPDQFKLIGKLKLPRKDSIAKTDGSAQFAMDVKLPGMVYAVILRSPRFGGRLTGFNADKAAEIAGFIDAKALPNGAGVAVYGKNTWAALKARDAITAEWDFSDAEMRSTGALIEAHRELTAAPQYQARALTTDAVQARLSAAPRTLDAEFVFPFLAHSPMEPLVCVIEPTASGVRVHDGCQFPTVAHGALSSVLKLKPEQVEIKTLYAGGSFGRRTTPTADYHVEAAMAFALLGGKTPVKMLWSREDDIHGGYYRPMALHKASIALDADGAILGWDHRVAAKSIVKGSAFESALVHEGLDHTTVEGLADTLYQVPNMALGVSDFLSPVPVLWWRSVGNTHTAYVMESLMDMLAHERGEDPIALRLSLLDRSNKEQARMAGVIEAARDMSGWQPGQKRGFAAHYSFNTFVAVVADITVEGNKVHVDKLHMAVDCGVAINPDVIRAQMEGGAGYALGAIMRNEITLDQGLVVQDNFPQYLPLRMPDMPEIAVTIVPSAEPPTGVGEPGVPPTGPALANAIFAVTGKRITELPMTTAGFSFV